jgi:replicative DNA helicase
MNTQIQKYTFHVHGMHCNACVLMTESELGDLPNITHVKSSLKNHSVEVTGDFGDKTQEQIAEELTVPLKPHGYTVSVEKQQHDAKWGDFKIAVPTGFAALDYKLSGFQPSDLIILAARPSMGKTSLALNIAQNAAIKHGKSIAIFSLEMSKEQLVDRLFASMLGVDSWKLQKGKLEDRDFQNMGPIMDDLAKANIFIDDSMGSSIPELRAKARRLQMEHGLDMIIIDFMQLMSTGNAGYTGNRVQEISEISRSLKMLGRELKIPIVALSQLSRAVESRPGNIPQLSDLRESGSIEQDADVVLMMYREDYYEEDSDRPGITDIYVRKHRNGPTGRVELAFKKEQMRFYDIDKTQEVKSMAARATNKMVEKSLAGVGDESVAAMAKEIKKSKK